MNNRYKQLCLLRSLKLRHLTKTFLERGNELICFLSFKKENMNRYFVTKE